MNFSELFQHFLATDQESPILASGYRKLDQLAIGGFKDELVVIGGRPTHGKTALMLNLILRFSYMQQQKGFVVMPMANSEYFARQMFSLITGREEDVNALPEDLALDGMSDLKDMLKNRLKVLHRSANLKEVLTMAKSWNASYVMLDDFFQVIDFLYGYKLYHESLKMVHSFAKETQIPVFIGLMSASSVDKRGGDRMPELVDLFRSDILCQYAHKVIQLYRPMAYGIEWNMEGEPTDNLVNLDLQKNSIGKTGMLSFEIQPSGRWEERSI
ncbi:DnaB-like helicase C-terminal domain-containing protein [Litoribacter populi]|uniref:DnaB-like helicase C-terminal domain-containing protein n=1 Tax=Litoribacter populi TaxID=2598460 RepID=UPI00117EEC0F|nr:DnaB-like helicase C-terminal domain-containing protein [Litoribacter populi]